MLREARDEQASRALDDLVVAAELTVQRQLRADGERRIIHQALRHRDGQQILRPGQTRHRQGGIVKLLAEHLMPIDGIIRQDAAQM